MNENNNLLFCLFDCADVVSLLPPTSKTEESKETNYDVSLVVNYASSSTGDVPRNYFSRFLSASLFLVV